MRQLNKIGVYYTINGEDVFFYRQEILSDESFSHEFGTEKLTSIELEWEVKYDSDEYNYDNLNAIEEFLDSNYRKILNEISEKYYL